MPDNDLPFAAGRDEARQVATGPDYDYTLSIEEAADRYATAGHPRTHRSVQRYCANNHLDCRKVTTLLGETYRVAPYSIARHIAQITEAIAVTGAAPGRDLSRQNATAVRQESPNEKATIGRDSKDDMLRPVATGRDAEEGSGAPQSAPPVHIEASARYVEQLEKRIDEKDDVIGLLRGELKTKNEQISDMSARARESNILMDGLRNLVLQLRPGPRDVPPKDSSAQEPDSHSFE